MVDLCQPFLAFIGGDWETIGCKVSEGSFPSDHAACSVWTISRHQNRVQFAYLLQAAGLLFTDTAAVAHPHLMTFAFSIPLQTVSTSKFSRGRGAEQGTISVFYIRILTFCLLRLWQKCSALAPFREFFSLPALFSIKQTGLSGG